MAATKRQKKPPPLVKAVKQPPSPRNQAHIEQSLQAYQRAPVRVSVAFNRGDAETLNVVAPHSDDAGHAISLMTSFATTSSAFTSQQLMYLDQCSRKQGDAPGESADALNSALVIVQAIDPRDELEAALASQMAACHSLAMKAMGWAGGSGNREHANAFVSMSTKLQRTFVAQIEALTKMRSGGKQVVEHRHVYVGPGGQAIVADEFHHHASGGAGFPNSKIGDQAYGTGQSQTSPAMLSQDQAGNDLPVPSDEERPVPDTRRAVDRSASRKSKRP